MPLTIATWNINSVRLREDLVCRLIHEESPDIICLQELKCPTEKFDGSKFVELGYTSISVRGQKSYNGVGIFSRIPTAPFECLDPLRNGHARHIAVKLANGIRIENFYVPAGGDIPDREENPKFGDKLDFLEAMRDWSAETRPRKTVLVGDLNVAPREDDVWSHKQLLNVVSHTPIEVDHFGQVQRAGDWVDIVREHIPEGKLYSWWSYRARDWMASDRGRRLDHIWITPDLVPRVNSCRILRHVRGWDRPSDHVPVIVSLELEN